MKTVSELIEMYEKELQDILTYRNADVITDIANVKDRTRAEAILRFIYNLKNLNEETVSEKNICVNVIHHTCTYFSLYTGCKRCTVKKFESKYE